MIYETVDFLVVDQIHSRSIPTRPIHMKSLSVLSNLELAHPTFHILQNVDLLLGITIFWDILEADRIQMRDKQPILTKPTDKIKMVWTLCGQIKQSISSQSHNNLTICGFVCRTSRVN